MLARMFGDNKDLSLLLIRIGFGLVFLFQGWNKVVDLESVTGFFASLNIPLPDLVGPLVAWIEFLGGIAILVGFLTRYAGLLLAFVMVVATFTFTLPRGLSLENGDFLGLIGGWDLNLLLFVMGLTLVFMGPGKIALETMMLEKEL